MLCGLSQNPKPKEGSDVEQRFAYGFTLAKKLGFVKDGDTVVLAYGWQSGMSSLTNFKMTTVTPESTKVARAEPAPAQPAACPPYTRRKPQPQRVQSEESSLKSPV